MQQKPGQVQQMGFNPLSGSHVEYFEQWEKMLEESGAEYFDIGLDSMFVSKDEAVKILRDLGYYAKEAGEVVDSIPVILMEDIPKGEVKKICRKLEKAFKIDLIPKKRKK